jgi:DNA repair protein RadC
VKRITRYDVRLVKEECRLYDLPDTVANSSRKAGEIVQLVCDIHNAAVEKFGVLCLNHRSEVVGVHIIHIGGISESLVDVRAVYQRALLQNASSVILFHNHPSGSPQPSAPDIAVTQRLRQAGATLDIKVLDHIIVYGDNKYTSMADSGLI